MHEQGHGRRRAGGQDENGGYRSGPDRDRGYRGGDRSYRGSGGDRGYRGRGGDRGYRGSHSSDRGYRSERRRFDNEPRRGTLPDLIDHLHALDGRSYAAYKGIVGRYEAPDGWILHIDRVQADPYAPPTRIRLEIPTDLPDLTILATDRLLVTPDRRLAVGDFLTRELHAGFRGTALSIAGPGQEILERSAVVLLANGEPGTAGTEPDSTAGGADSPAWTIEVRARLSLPARGRSIQGHEAARIIDRDLTREVSTALDLSGERAKRLLTHVAALEDHRALTAAVRENGWVSFLADGSILPRRSGVSDEPMHTGAVPLVAPRSLAATVELPHAGTVRGTAVGPGVTLIVGGGYHGKSTLLSAVERGVYPHVPGDGRELVATVPDAVKIRAADGRAVTGVDLSPFISHLPGGRDTASFTTRNASGSTSQAASLMEAVEAGASALLLDEDTSATNLLIRDSRMRALVADEREPITPLVDRVGALAAAGVSTVLVMGGSGDYLDVADRVLLLDSYELRDATAEAAAVVAAQPRPITALPEFAAPAPRRPLPSPPRQRRGPVRTRAHGRGTLTLDREEIDISDVAGVVDPGQAEALAYALRALLERHFDGASALTECLEDLEALVDDEGLDALDERAAFLVRPRAVDVAGAVNRYRLLELA